MAKSSTTFSKENPRPGPGRRKLTEAQAREARLQRAADYDYKKELAALFPIVTDQLAECLAKKGFKSGELVHVYETVRDTLHGKPAQTLQGPGGGPLVGSFAVLLASVDGTRGEKLVNHIEAVAITGGHNGNGNGAHEKL